ncbi:Rieske 2Fe-2S domain-containing protein [Nocardioides sp. zg-579]|uniref:Rieske 2Fe-2S domain-containing protein n=1 Tax=Nocardioides marmotae TaxID=2663857 RepID=A0A6I3JCJ0_9ACTN|nr:Rieske (2Fe-2S) protein [Nocardioides marmotae]MCR6032133.1 Rieske 2Fe-2S domain-containing protein [Gordonia jinghuaiqii]MTB95779.1 Rieske 2Fe-2S domain-containing protein [Nocardioides marmotae]QKE02861.1 Rieske (2Fe-2S) protein [Nocardioides marmotae]
MDVRVGTVEEVRRDGCRIVEVDGRAVGVISVGEDFYAITDRCPHMGASMCAGSLGGTMLASRPHEYVYGLADRVIRCPWHGWEFDLETGRSLLEPRRRALRTWRVTQQDGDVVLHT